MAGSPASPWLRTRKSPRRTRRNPPCRAPHFRIEQFASNVAQLTEKQSPWTVLLLEVYFCLVNRNLIALRIESGINCVQYKHPTGFASWSELSTRCPSASLARRVHHARPT